MLLGLVDLAVTGCIGGGDGEPYDPIALLVSTTAGIPIVTVKLFSSAAAEIRMLAHLKFGLPMPLTLLYCFCLRNHRQHRGFDRR